MAIIFLKEPSNLAPAYNDTFLHFKTTNSISDHRAELEIGGYTFTIYPDLQREYLFNLKSVVSALINIEKFRDTDHYINDGIPENDWWRSDNNLHKDVIVKFTVWGNDSFYGENSFYKESKTYGFTKAVRQYGDKQYPNKTQLMLPSKDGLNYHLTYFEGFPCDITFQTIATNEVIYFLNNRTQQQSPDYVGFSNNPHRFTFDNGMSNVHLRGDLDLPDMVNDLGIYASGVKKTSLNVKKVAARCGTHLKWFNADGSYSYWLFNQFYKQDYAGETLEVIGNNYFENIYNNNRGTIAITGKNGEQSLKLTTLADEHEKEHLVSLVTSPMVQMWSAQEPFSDGEWIDVIVTSKGFEYASKRDYNRINVTIQLPPVQTQFL